MTELLVGEYGLHADHELIAQLVLGVDQIAQWLQSHSDYARLVLTLQLRLHAIEALGHGRLGILESVEVVLEQGFHDDPLRLIEIQSLGEDHDVAVEIFRTQGFRQPGAFADLGAGSAGVEARGQRHDHEHRDGGHR